jgi:pimeloyl-ACP methyl ester carboxylesterase
MTADNPRHQMVDTDQATLSVYEWGTEHRGIQPTLLLLHATGFHARCWDQIVGLLPDRHILALDQRGHGLSSKGMFEDWHCFADDLEAVVDSLRLENVVGVGHSMGGVAALMVASRSHNYFSKLLLLDPVILPPEVYQAASAGKIQESPGGAAAKRRDTFASMNALREGYARRPPFSLFTAEALADYCQYGVEQLPDGSVVLLCPPDFESAVYAKVFSAQPVLDSLERVQIPVTVVRAMQPETREQLKDFRYSRTWPQLAEHLPKGRDVEFDDLTHFMPMEDPQRVARLIADL